jgi:hypothetical protein
MGTLPPPAPRQGCPQSHCNTEGERHVQIR